MDTIVFGAVFAFTAIDIWSREADILLCAGLTSQHGVVFLRLSMKRRFGGHVQLVQTDGGPEFKGEFALRVKVFCDRHRIARPYRKNEQAHIESFNRTVRQECLGWNKYTPEQLPNLPSGSRLFWSDIITIDRIWPLNQYGHHLTEVNRHVLSDSYGNIAHRN